MLSKGLHGNARRPLSPMWISIILTIISISIIIYYNHQMTNMQHRLLVAAIGDERTPIKYSAEVTFCEWGEVLCYLPFYIAVEKGFFAENGIKVKVIERHGDDLVWGSVRDGEAQFGIADPVFVALEKEKTGLSGKCIATIVNKPALWIVTYDQSVTADNMTVDFLKGKRIGAFPPPNTAYALLSSKIMNLNLPHISQPTILPFDPMTVLEKLKIHDFDYALLLEPDVSEATLTGGEVVCSFPEVFGDFTFTGLTTTDQYMTNNYETCCRVVNAFERALGFMHADLEGTIECAIERFPNLPENVIRKAVQRMCADSIFPDHTEVSSISWNKAMELRRATQELKTDLPFNQCVDNKFAEIAKNFYKGVTFPR